ncbi:MAG TPA: penicillin-binding protein 2, partial [Gemmatimonadales bacterium]
RGAIIDRNGLTIAENEPGYTVKLFAPSPDSMRAVLARLATIIPLDSTTRLAILSRFRTAQYQPALVTGGADFATVSKLEEHRYLLPGLVVQTEPRRIYRTHRAVAHLVGYVSEVSDADLERNRFPGARMGSIVGKDGLEQQYDSLLRGIDGVRYTEVDSRGRMVREEVSSPSLSPVAGSSITTTIDLPLQEYIDSMWSAERPGIRGAMVAMTPDGGVLALYSAPTFDPNDFVGGIESDVWKSYTTDAALPLYNRALQATYPPASPFKLATAVIALRRGIVNFSTHMPEPCRGALQYGSRAFKCWRREGHGSLDLTGAIAASCDVYFYQLGLRIGLPGILEDGTKIGFGERSGIDLGKETRPIFPQNTEYYNRRYGPRGWTPAVTLNVAIGQGENSQTLMNMMRFYAALAGDGTEGAPYIVARRDSVRTRDLGLTPEQLTGLRAALCAVVQRGTAAGSGGRELNVCGKTGTAQNPHGSDHGWFIGYAPADHPKIVVGAIMEDLGGHGGASVAPYVVRVIQRYLIRQDSTLLKARVKVPVVPDSVTGADSTIRPDTIPR